MQHVEASSRILILLLQLLRATSGIDHGVPLPTNRETL